MWSVEVVNKVDWDWVDETAVEGTDPLVVDRERCSEGDGADEKDQNLHAEVNLMYPLVHLQ